MGKPVAVCILISLLLILSLSPGYAIGHYDTIGLSKLQDGQASIAYSISDNGWIAGTTYVSSYSYATRWNGSLVPTNLGTGAGGVAYGVNNSGEAVGTLASPLIWDSTGWHTLGCFTTQYRGVARAINDSGQIVGSSDTYTLTHPSYWYAGSRHTIHELALPTGYNAGCANAVNDNGLIVGEAYIGFNPGLAHAVVWDQQIGPVSDPGPRDLGLLDGYTSSTARGVNNSSIIAGVSANRSSAPTSRACIWDSTGVHALSLLQGFSYSESYGINDSGVVVGMAYNQNTTTAADCQACYWDADGAHQLSALAGYSCSIAYGINSDGWIVGYSYNRNGLSQATLWQPVPEPGTMLALLAGLGSLVLFRKRR